VFKRILKWEMQEFYLIVTYNMGIYNQAFLIKEEQWEKF